eukprot:3928739-Heterocapsa_arctica.AAC.1
MDYVFSARAWDEALKGLRRKASTVKHSCSRSISRRERPRVRGGERLVRQAQDGPPGQEGRVGPPSCGTRD